MVSSHGALPLQSRTKGVWVLLLTLPCTSEEDAVARGHL